MDRYALLYDEISAGLYKNLGRFLSRNIRFAGKRVLCLASGTGFFPEFYLNHGARHVTSVDISPDFLRLARKRLKAHPRGDDVDFVRADMSKFETTKRYDLVFINGNSFCYLLTQEAQLECLRNIRTHLRIGGHAYIHFVPLSRQLNADFKARRSFRRPGSGRLVEDTTVAVDLDRHLLDFHTTWTVRGRKYRDVTRTRIMTLPEFSLLVQIAGLRISRRWGEYRRRIPTGTYRWIYELEK